MYGELLDGDANLTAFLYNGQYGVMTDANGLNYMRARYYDSSTGRFINRDILTGSIEDSRSLNRYAYCYGNPVSYTDPFGLSPLVSVRNHAVLDVIGMIPGPIGVAADLINAVYYLVEGNTSAAIVCMVFAIVPGNFAGNAVQLMGASKTAGQIVNSVVGMAVCGYGVYNNASQVSGDIERIAVNWDYYTDEEKSLEMQIIACDIMGIAGSAAGSVSSAHNLAKMEVYQKWEEGAVQTIRNAADDATSWISDRVEGLLNLDGIKRGSFYYL